MRSQPSLARSRTPWARCIVAALLAWVVAAAPAHAQRVIDTGIYLTPNTDTFWLDPDTVLTAGYPSADGSVPRAFFGTPQVARLIEYHATGNQLVDRGLVSPGGPCFDAGYARFARPVAGTENTPEPRWQAYYGPYGNEKPAAVRKLPPGAFNPLSWLCTFEDELPPLPQWTSGKPVKRLRPQDGFFELSDTPWPVWYPVKYFRAGAAKEDGVALDAFRNLEIEWPPKFEAATGAYLIGGRRSRGDDGVFRYELRRLYPDGKLAPVLSISTTADAAPHTLSIAGGSSVRFPWRVAAIAPLARGRFVFDGGAITGRGKLADSGLYMFDGRDFRKLARGRVKAISVSPDGCRAAAGLDSNEPIGPDRFKLLIVDVCKE